MASLQDTLTGIQGSLSSMVPTLSIILIILAGVVYGLAQLQPPDTRGKWQNMAIALLVGGIIMMAIFGAADIISNSSRDLLK